MKKFMDVFMLSLIYPDGTDDCYSFVYENHRDEFIKGLETNHKDVQYMAWQKVIVIEEE